MSKEERFEKFYDDIVKNDLEKMKYSENEAIKEQNITIIKILLTPLIMIVFACMVIANFDEENLIISFAILMLSASMFPVVMIRYIINLIKKRRSKSEKYDRDYEEIIIRKMIKSFNQNLEYFPEKGIRKIDYMEANFENFDTYMSEDLIIGNINDEYRLSISEVLTQIKSGGTKEVPLYLQKFQGIFVNIEIPKHLETVIYIKKDENDKNILNKALNKITIQSFLNGLDVQLDSQEFEKIFDVYASNEMEAMQLLTSDVMRLLVDFYNKTKSYYEICIKNSHIYIRFELMYLVNQTSLDKEQLYKYYSVLDFIIEISNKLATIINEKNYIN